MKRPWRDVRLCSIDSTIDSATDGGIDVGLGRMGSGSGSKSPIVGPQVSGLSGGAAGSISAIQSYEKLQQESACAGETQCNLRIADVTTSPSAASAGNGAARTKLRKAARARRNEVSFNMVWQGLNSQ